jgi:glycosyltransferase involved in cell wall biosynthesis
VHAASDLEAEAMRAYGCRALIQVIPNPVEPIGAPPDAQARVDRLFPELRGAPYVLALGRMHPMKGLDLLVEAWSRVNREFPDWRLWIVGPDEAGTADRLRRQIRQAGMDQRIRLGGAVHGDDKQALLAQAGLFVLPSRTENFGMVVAEALSAGVPVIATRATPWRALDGKDGGNFAPEQCGWWVETSVDGLAGGLREALALDAAARRSLGARGCEWVWRTCQPEKCCIQLIKLYRETMALKRENEIPVN